jgi:uncharacterized protein
MRFEPSTLIYINEAPGKGRGVFAKVAIKEGEVIETVPVLFMRSDEFHDLNPSNIGDNYVYYWDDEHVAIALGYGSIYNHSRTPEADYEFGDHSISYIALRDIAPDEEIHINYENDPDDQSPLPFEVG